jgi:hypothetical protein
MNHNPQYLFCCWMIVRMKVILGTLFNARSPTRTSTRSLAYIRISGLQYVFLARISEVRLKKPASRCGDQETEKARNQAIKNSPASLVPTCCVVVADIFHCLSKTYRYHTESYWWQMQCNTFPLLIIRGVLIIQALSSQVCHFAGSVV